MRERRRCPVTPVKEKWNKKRKEKEIVIKKESKSQV